MISIWWLVVASFVWLALLVWTRDMAYRHGIWDGAFNHFLPVVRGEMLFYDRHRAASIFEQEAPDCNE
jgi:hypothetical protein